MAEAAFGQMRLRSLRARLLASLLLAIGVAAVGFGVVAYRSALAEANGLFDYNMRQMALSLRSGNPLASLPPGIDQEPGWQGIDFAVQVRSLDGVSLFASSRDLILPARPEPGFSEVTTPRGRYRIYAMATPSRLIQVAQELAVRERLARGFAWRTIAPVAALLPLLLLLVWGVVTRSLAPVARVQREIAARAADDLAPVATATLPDEIRPLVDELNALLERLQAAFATQRHFVADAAHELRTPLAALDLQLQRLRRADSAAERDAALGRLAQGIERATTLVEQLLVLARQQEGARAGEAFTRVDLSQLARDAVVELADMAAAAGVDIGFADAAAAAAGSDTGSEPAADTGAVAVAGAAVAGYPPALQILVRNLLQNAIKYSGHGGIVDVSVRGHVAGQVELVVEDSGPGIPLAERGRVFDRFWRGTSRHAAAGGSGLGLAIVKAIADRHEAVIELDDSPTRGGLRVRVRFSGVG